LQPQVTISEVQTLKDFLPSFGSPPNVQDSPNFLKP